MTNLAMMAFDDMPGGFGLWMFLSISAVALFVVFIPLTSWIDSQRREREAFYKAETMRRLAESSGEGARAAIEMLREQDRLGRAKKREGMKIGGLVNIAVGVAMLAALWRMRALVETLLGLWAIGLVSRTDAPDRLLGRSASSCPPCSGSCSLSGSLSRSVRRTRQRRLARRWGSFSCSRAKAHCHCCFRPDGAQ